MDQCQATRCTSAGRVVHERGRLGAGRRQMAGLAAHWQTNVECLAWGRWRLVSGSALEGLGRPHSHRKCEQSTRWRKQSHTRGGGRDFMGGRLTAGEISPLRKVAKISPPKFGGLCPLKAPVHEAVTRTSAFGRCSCWSFGSSSATLLWHRVAILELLSCACFVCVFLRSFGPMALCALGISWVSPGEIHPPPT